MPANRSFPLGGIVLALIACAALLWAGFEPVPIAATLLLWIGSLLIARPEPDAPPPPIDAEAIAAHTRAATLEPLTAAVVVIEGTRIVMANSSARAVLGAHVAGQDARIALRHPEAMRVFSLSDGESVTISGFAGARSLWQLTRRRVDGSRWMIELTNRTAEADISRAQTDFVANASHELRTPLASIIGYVETLEDGGPALDAAATKRFLGIVLREAKRMLSLVEDLMMLSQVEAEKHDRPQEQLDLAQLAARVVAEVASLSGKERVALARVQRGANVRGDARQLEQLLRNLIDNALKYGAPDQPVTVEVFAATSGARLAVIDRGPGIAPEHLPLLTRRFYRTDPGRSRASGGTGLGLAIVKHIVERHRALLDIASEVNVGSTVSVDFPPVVVPESEVSQS